MKEENKEYADNDHHGVLQIVEHPQVFIDERVNPEGSGVFVTALLLIGTRLGAGIVGLPYAVSVMGPAVGL